MIPERIIRKHCLDIMKKWFGIYKDHFKRLPKFLKLRKSESRNYLYRSGDQNLIASPAI